MRNKKKREKQSGSGFRKFTRFYSIIYLAVIIAFAVMVVRLNVLTARDLLIAGGIVFLLTLITFPYLFFKNFKQSRRIIAFILSLALTCVYGVGIYYIADTINFISSITSAKEETSDYFVVVHNDSVFESEKDLSGIEVETYMDRDFEYSEAKSELLKKADVTYVMNESLASMAQDILDRESDAMLISEAQHVTLCGENSSFAENTRIIYTVKLRKEQNNNAKSVSVTEEPFNVLVSGLDIEGSIDNVSRSDVNMIVTVNPRTHKVLLTSIPRDYYVELPGKDNAMDKLTHSGLYGISETIGTVENFTDLDMNYYVKVNYTTVKKLIDAIGGIDVESDFTFTTHGMGVYYEFYEGSNHLDGARALAFARERKSFSDGDLQRNRNQQKVLEGVLRKGLSSETILLKYSNILSAIEDNVEINMSPEDMQKLIKMQIDKMPSWHIEKQNIIGGNGSEMCYSVGNSYCSVVTPDEESIIKAVDKIVSTMEE